MIGKQILHFNIVEKIGEGGMGVVYKAEDTKLKRAVAIKFLPPELTRDPDAKQRFVREAQAASALDHPYIGTIHEINETGDGQLFIAMACYDGETLKQRIERGPLKIRDSIELAAQVAEGLSKAHEQGIIHRDIKPANVMVTGENRVKILDFGLAKLQGQSQFTKAGTTLGTVAYMSPEQLRGEVVDHRTDIWSMGAMIYEMVTGRLPFTGDYEQAVTYAIMNEEPEPMTGLRTSVPMELERIVAKAMAKEPAERYQHVDELPVDLRTIDVRRVGNSQVTPAVSVAADLSVTEKSSAVARLRRWAIPLSFAAVLGLAIAGWMKSEEPQSSPARYLVPVPTGYINRYGIPTLALSPEGRTLVYGTEGRLYAKAVDKFEGEPLTDTEGARGPFFSPDGRWLGFTQRGTLKKLSIDGGPIVEIAPDIGPNYAASWDENDAIVYTPVFGTSGLWRVPATGGKPEQITTVIDSALEKAHLWPQVLGGSDLVMFTALGPSGGWDDAKIVVKNLKTGSRTTVLERATYGRYIPTGHIMYMQSTGALVAVPFDLGRLEVTGPPMPVQSDVRVAVVFGAASYAVSDNGTLAFVQGSIWTGMSLRWVDRDGSSRGQIGAAMYGHHVKLSPDGQRLAMTIRGPNNDDIFFIDTITGEQDRFTFHSAEDETPVWSPDGSRVAYSATWTGQAQRIYTKPVDASTEPTLLYTGKHHLHLSSWSPNGRWLAMTEFHPSNQQDIWALNLDSVEHLIPIATMEAAETDAQFSPDGRWLAYSSNETGRDEIYVVSFPETALRRQVSTDGGLGPRWAASSNELFYWSGGTLMAVKVSIEDAFTRETPRPLFSDPDMAGSDFDYDVLPDYDVTQDGTRFLLLAAKPDAAAKEIHVVLNWFEELKRKVPTEK